MADFRGQKLVLGAADISTANSGDDFREAVRPAGNSSGFWAPQVQGTNAPRAHRLGSFGLPAQGPYSTAYTYWRAMPFIVPEDGYVYSLSYWFSTQATLLQGGIYSDVDDRPGVKLAETGIRSAWQQLANQEFSLLQPLYVQKGSRIWIALLTKENEPNFYYYASAGYPGRASGSVPDWAGTLPDSFGSVSINNSYAYCWSANYSASPYLGGPRYDATDGVPPDGTSYANPTTRRAFPFTFSEDGSLHKIYMRIKGTAENFKMGLYNGDSYPTTLLEDLGTFAWDGNDDDFWCGFDLSTPVSISAGQKVWLAIVSESGTMSLWFGDGPPGRALSSAPNDYAAGMPSSWGSYSVFDYTYAIFPAYTAAETDRRRSGDRVGIDRTVFGNDVIFNRVWVQPTSIDAGFITEASDYDVIIWNGWLGRSVQFTSMAVTNESGTSMDYPTLPKAIAPSGAEDLTLTVEETGPAIQDTIWTPTVDGAEYDIGVTGIRVLGLRPMPNWAKDVQIKYGFETVLNQTERFAEQRRPLTDEPQLSCSVTFLVYGDEGKRFFYELSYAHDKLFGVPVYNEMVIPTTIPQGGTTIDVPAEAIDYFYYLNNLAEYVAIIDHTTGTTELKLIDSVNKDPTNTIVTVEDISNTFNTNRTRLYPLFIGLVQRVKFNEHTEEHDTVTVDFLEYF